ncbi:DUF397 domain-containing protein [Streptomyces sp. WAC04114]|uniref:DUF397 domain-containing protein n=1 Tax=Streptomyces sp. WAC04114 TaxID=2867961 RepID=UPI001C8CDF47|nr:DUF397 domain-containing protein [Streptomyces sp. WAC04114]MBX9366494.1 DUF397 domain-containing protein [Streptomyces sp. WAC04114]
MPASPLITSEPRWFKSSYSGGNATECVECAFDAQGALIRDSKISRGPFVPVSGEAWRCFVTAVRTAPVREAGQWRKP